MEADLSAINEREAWELSHIFEHARLANRYSRNGNPLLDYPLDFSFTPAWKFLHNEVHRELRQRSGVKETYNFSDFDPNDADAVEAHYIEHQQVAAAAPT